MSALRDGLFQPIVLAAAREDGIGNAVVLVLPIALLVGLFAVMMLLMRRKQPPPEGATYTRGKKAVLLVYAVLGLLCVLWFVYGAVISAVNGSWWTAAGCLVASILLGGAFSYCVRLSRRRW